MTFSPLAAKIVHSMQPYLPTTPTVVELGNQRLSVTPDIIQECKNEKLNLPQSIQYEKLSQLCAKTNKEKLDKTSEFFKLLGFADYKAIDLNSAYGSYSMDLNSDLEEKYGFKETFDLVTNNGTGEHIFNQYSVFKNMHQLTAKNGIMLHIMPFVNWVNHGFFNFHPILYLDLAKVNNYKVVHLSIGVRTGEIVPVNLTDEYDYKKNVPHLYKNQENKSWKDALPSPLRKFLYNTKLSLNKAYKTSSINELSVNEIVYGIKGSTDHALALAIDKLKKKNQNIFIVAALQKVEDSEFAMPVQGKYFETIEPNELQKTYEARA